MKEIRYLTEEDKRMLRERFNILQKEQSAAPSEVTPDSDTRTKVLAAAQKKLNEGEPLEEIFDYCYKAGLLEGTERQSKAVKRYNE